jgi:hypothetical protein
VSLSLHRPRNWTIGRLLGIGLLVASVMRVPLPQADYHNIRHHDAPGENCPFHDHLLRWHPSATVDADVALLHWHWFVPLAESDDPNHHANGGDRQGPFVHAHFSDWPEPHWLDQPVINPDARVRFAGDETIRLAAVDWAYLSNPLAPACFGQGFSWAFRPGGAEGLRTGRTALLQRWNC